MDAIFADIAKALFSLGSGGVVGAVMFYMWKMERDERRAAQESNLKMLEATISSRQELASTLEKIADKIGA